MRQFIVFIIVAAIVFFAVGEWRGWHIGIAGQTPVYVYKKDSSAEVTRRTINLDHLPLTLSGEVNAGSVRVQIIYERPTSFQTSAAGVPPQTVFDQTYTRGQRIAINEAIREGQGIYTVRLEFSGATGLFRVGVPAAAGL